MPLPEGVTLNKFLQSKIKQAETQGISRFAVGAVIFHRGTVLLLERTQDDYLGGLWELPSGKMKLGESLLQALVREVREETGLDIAEIYDYCGHFDYLSQSGRQTRQFNFILLTESNLVQLGEHSRYAWIVVADYFSAQSIYSSSVSLETRVIIENASAILNQHGRTDAHCSPQ